MLGLSPVWFMVGGEHKTMYEIAVGIVRRLQQAGYEAYLVGGCVRDMLLGREPKDYDIATSARPEEVGRLFPRHIEMGKQFGVLVVLEGGYQFQVATFRSESGYLDGRHPSNVQYSDACADAMRRDFTVNGIFYDPEAKRHLDWVGGMADLQARLIRTIGDPDKRFTEDHLRMLRALRLAVELGFRIDGATFDAVRRNAWRIRDVSAERIREELERMFNPCLQGVVQPGDENLPLVGGFVSRAPRKALVRALELLHLSGLLRCVLPELEATVGCEHKSKHHPEGSVYEHILLMLDNVSTDADPLLVWCVLMHDIGKPVTMRIEPGADTQTFHEHDKVGAELTESIMTRLRFPAKQVKLVAQVVRYHMQFKDVPHMKRSTLRRMMLRPTFDLELQLHRLDCLGSHRDLSIYEFLLNARAELQSRSELVPPLVRGADLLALGMTPGPELGRLLHEIREKQLQDELKTREEALAWARARLTQSRNDGRNDGHRTGAGQ